MTKTASKTATTGKPAKSERPNPARMVRKQLLITPEQNRRIKALAAASGRTEADLLREAIEAKLALSETQDWKAGWLAAAGMWADFPGIEDQIADARERRRRRRERTFGSGGADGG
jgi:predicted DNA-binding protein